MEGAEVAEEKGVGGEVSELIRLWKSVEKSKPVFKKRGCAPGKGPTPGLLDY